VTGQPVRAVVVEGKPMLVATEIAAILGYKNPRETVGEHCKYTKLLKEIDSTPLTPIPRGINLIPESDVYRLIMRSKLPVAEQFEAWVTETVLPAIRNDGVSAKCPAPP
jgi:prophage antirepressor-like protein